MILTYPIEYDGNPPLEGKFLQLNLSGRDYLLFAATTECRYHNHILGRFLSEQAIPHHWEGTANLIVEHPELAVTGGGRFRLDPIRKSLHLWDESSVYGRFDPSRLALQLAAAGPPWDRLVVQIE
jgi:hypothetical protein